MELNILIIHPVKGDDRRGAKSKKEFEQEISQL